jgi:hypothetical protein
MPEGIETTNRKTEAFIRSADERCRSFGKACLLRRHAKCYRVVTEQIARLFRYCLREIALREEHGKVQGILILEVSKTRNCGFKLI